MKYGELNGLTEAIKALRTQPQSFSIARRLKDVCDAVEKENKWFNEQVQGIVNRCAAKDEDGNPLETSDGGVQIENTKEFENLVNELMNTDTAAIPTMSEDDLKQFKVSAEQLDFLLLICEVKENE